MFEMISHRIRKLLLDPEKVLSRTFFISVLCIPLTGLLWHFGWFSVRLNWIALVFFLLGVVFYLIRGRKLSALIIFYFLSLSGYALIFYRNNGEFESLLRFFVSILPLLFLEPIRKHTDAYNMSVFRNIYLASLSIPVVLSVLQLTGHYPFYDADKAFWLVDEGRISGGYLKPNNLIVYIFPAFLWGIHWLMKKEYVKGSVLVILCMLIVVTSALRIAIVIYSLILIFYFAPRVLIKAIDLYYTLCLPLIIGVLSLVVLGLWFEWYGPYDALRYRLPMWQAHANHFLHADIGTMLTGYSSVNLPGSYHQFPEIRYFYEAHNNSLRIITTFGLVGFLLYCTLMQRLVLSLNRLASDVEHQFLSAASILFFLVYSVTNEPSFYVSVFWCITCLLFVCGNSAPPRENASLRV